MKSSKAKPRRAPKTQTAALRHGVEQLPSAETLALIAALIAPRDASSDIDRERRTGLSAALRIYRDAAGRIAEMAAMQARGERDVMLCFIDQMAWAKANTDRAAAEMEANGPRVSLGTNDDDCEARTWLEKNGSSAATFKARRGVIDALCSAFPWYCRHAELSKPNSTVRIDVLQLLIRERTRTESRKRKERRTRRDGAKRKASKEN